MYVTIDDLKKKSFRIIFIFCCSSSKSEFLDIFSDRFQGVFWTTIFKVVTKSDHF